MRHRDVFFYLGAFPKITCLCDFIFVVETVTDVQATVSDVIH